jgi:hypothetical protein
VGDCDDTNVVATDGIALTTIFAIDLEPYDPLLQIDNDLPGEAGVVITKNRPFLDLLAELNFNTTSTVPYVDWEQDQVGAVWYQARKSCGIEIDGVHIKTRSDGTAVFDVSLVDIRKNCADNCDGPSQALVMNLFSNELPTTICRRIAPGCPP